LLIVLAGSGGRAAAVLLPLYYLADGTLLRRAVRSEPVWQAHRSDFCQRAATDNGFHVIEVVARVWAVNLALAVLACDNSAAVANDGHYRLERRRSARYLVFGWIRAWARTPLAALILGLADTADARH
jgi:hypothetical protein